MVVHINGRTVNRGIPVCIGVEQDQQVETIKFTGLPEGMSCTMAYTRADGTLGAEVLTEQEMVVSLPLTATSGDLYAQLIGADGDRVWHSNPFTIHVTEGLQGDFGDIEEASEGIIEKLTKLTAEIEKRIAVVDGLVVDLSNIEDSVDRSVELALNRLQEQVDSGRFNGRDGVDGKDGAQGERGEQGLQGEKGEKGDTGEQGLQGIQGEKGEKEEEEAMAVLE